MYTHGAIDLASAYLPLTLFAPAYCKRHKPRFPASLHPLCQLKCAGDYSKPAQQYTYHQDKDQSCT